MFVALITILYKLIMRFPALVLLIYSVYMFEGTLIEKEAKEIQEIETVELLTNSHVNHDFANDLVDLKTINKVTFCQWNSPKIEFQFIKTSYLKLYILYSKLLIDQCELGFRIS